jgi:hypothetical protein
MNRFILAEGLAECKELVQDMVKVVQANKPDTINYEYYLNNAETSCVITGAYKNSEAALVHLKGVASLTCHLRYLVSANMHIIINSLKASTKAIYVSSSTTICFLSEKLMSWPYP